MLAQNRAASKKKCSTRHLQVFTIFQVFHYMTLLRHGDEFGFRSFSFSVVRAA